MRWQVRLGMAGVMFVRVAQRQLRNREGVQGRSACGGRQRVWELPVHRVESTGTYSVKNHHPRLQYANPEGAGTKSHKL